MPQDNASRVILSSYLLDTTLDSFDDKSGGQEAPAARKNMRSAEDEGLRRKFHEILGVDLTAVPTINIGTVEAWIGELGPDLSRFPSAAALANWLGLCPGNTITGGRVVSSKTRKVENRLAAALRMAAESLCRDKSYLGQFYRRIKMRLDGPEAITAAAHKLVRIIYALLKKRVEYDPSHFEKIEQKNRQKQHQRLARQARELGYALVPKTATGAVVS